MELVNLVIVQHPKEM